MKRFSDAEYKYVKEVLDGEFRASNMSKMIARFESAFAEKFGTAYAISHNSGTSTLHSAVAAVGASDGGEVIVPPLTMASTTLSVLYESAIPVFVDVDPNTFNLDPSKVEQAISPRTKAIMPVSVYGLSPDFDPIMQIAAKHNLKVIEDDAETYLGKYKGRLVGSIGHLSSFSLQGSKHITSGEGGVVLTNDEALADKVRQFAIVGYDIVRAKSGELTRSKVQSPDFIRHTSLGFKYKMSDICAAVALGQLERLDELVKMRQLCGKTFKAAVEGCDWIKPQLAGPDFEHSYYTFAARLDLSQVDFSWHDFRSKFIELGGDGFYAAWRLTYHEPMWKSQDFRIRNVVQHPRYSANFVETCRSSCPNAELIQPQIMQFKTNYYESSEVEQQAEVLQRTIKFFEG
ncbi:MAG: DegT/DnrJ/EryC1/StrS family aminotransferase [Bdellovibrionales bacterium]|nr:DegT/DnrJ/EryC1/StrS family aminotransferase [Bdellovibrionales bacterium]